MVVHPAAGHADGTLVNALLHHVDDLSGIGGEKRPGIVHRLDRGTSGLMVVAKNDAAHEELARQFHDREVEKEYIALVWGVVQAGPPDRRADRPRSGEPEEDVGAVAPQPRRRSRASSAPSTCRALTLAQVAIHTGRTHQIRVHLSAIGHPIVGDALYGGVHRRVARDMRAVSRLERPFLHAAHLVFKHPADGRRMEFTSPLPEDLQKVLDRNQRRRRSDRDREVRPCPSSMRAAVFSVEVERVRLPNGREHEVAIVRHPPSVVLIPMPDPRPRDPHPPVPAQPRPRDLGAAGRAASIPAKRPKPPRAASARRRSATCRDRSSGCAGCIRRRASATRS